MRICSLLPSATEIIGALGLADRLVGVSAECDWPPEVRGLPVVTRARVDTDALASAEIDAAVRAALVEGRSLYAVDEELLSELVPDLIITQDLCAVCAVSSGDVTSICAAEVDVVSLDPRSVQDVEESVRVLGNRLGVPDRAVHVVVEMERELERVRSQVAGLNRPRVFVAEWLDPPFAAGHWVPEMVETAGGAEVMGRPGAPSFATTWDDVLACEPELVVLAPCGFDAARAACEADVLPPLPCRVVAVDANARYSRPAPRIVEGAAQLAFFLHPEAVPDPGFPWVEHRPAARASEAVT